MRPSGKNSHMPVLNLCETVFVRKPFPVPPGQPHTPSSGSGLVASDVFSPAQVLSAPTATTIRARWAQWSALTSRGAGKKVCAGTALGGVLEAIPWKTTIVVRDNLIVNDCIVCLEEETLAAAEAEWQSHCGHAFLSVACCSHSAVLAMRPMMESLGKVPFVLVRLAHLLESGRVASAYVDAIRSLLEEPGGFEFRECVRLPAESAT